MYKEPSISTLSHTTTTAVKQAEWLAGNKVKGSTDDFVGHATDDNLDTSLQYINGSGWLSVTLGDFDATRTARSISIKATSENTTGSDRTCRVFLKNSKYKSNRFILVTLVKKTDPTPEPIIKDNTTYYINFDPLNTNWITDTQSHFGAQQLTSHHGYIVASSYDLELYTGELLTNVLQQLYTVFGSLSAASKFTKLKIQVNTDGNIVVNPYSDSDGYVCIDILCPISSTNADDIVKSTWTNKGKQYIGRSLYLYRLLNTYGTIYALAKYADSIGSLSTSPSLPTTNVEIIYRY